MKRAALIIFLVLLIDQVVKIWVKTHMYLGQEYHIADNWFIIHFTENYGMAFGLEFGGHFGKFFLSFFRIIASAGIAWYLWFLIKSKAHAGAIISFALIFAGAIGNIIDSAFYGLIFSDSEQGISTLFPAGGGYAGLLQGRVVDMLYFPIIHGHFPAWFPFWGTEDFMFFRPVFNISDSSISIGVFLLLLFHKKFFPQDTQTQPVAEEQQPNTDPSNQ
jgi:signal peptidase II